MTNKLKLTLLALFLIQFGILAWSYFGKKQEDEQFHQAIGQYLDHPEKVQHLDLSNMSLKKLPKEIIQFQNLVSLNLSNNRFKEIPNKVYQLSNLKHLDISYNRIKEIEFQDNYSIEQLNLSYNQIEYIDYFPCSVGCLKALQSINISHNKLEECPTFNNSSSIDTILLSNNNLNSFYNLHMSLPENIGYLDISSNEIEGINEDLYDFIGFDYGDLVTLANKCESINLSNNDFEYFPYRLFSNNTKASKIIMRNCIYNDTKDEIPSFLTTNNFQFLDLSNTSYYLDDFEFNDLTNLNNLQLENTKFDNFLINLPYLNKLNIKGISITETFDIRCPTLEHLEIDYAGIIALIDSDLERIPNLKTVVIAGFQDDEYLIARLEAFYPNLEIILE